MSTKSVSGEGTFRGAPRRRRAESLRPAPHGVARAGARGAGTVSGDQIRHRSADRQRLLLRLRSRRAVHARRPRAHRDARATNCSRRTCPSPRGVGQGARARAFRTGSDSPTSSSSSTTFPATPSPSTRWARFVDLCAGPHIDSTKRIKHVKLLSTAGAYWRGDSKQTHAAAYLRHRLLQEERPRRLHRPAWPKRKARPSAPRHGTRSLRRQGRGRRRVGVLAPQGCGRARADGAVSQERVPQARLPTGVHAAHREGRAVEDIGPPRRTTATTCSPWTSTAKSTSSSR